MRGWVAPLRLRLAIGAKVAAAISDGKTLDGSTADRARLAAEVSDTEVELGSA